MPYGFLLRDRFIFTVLVLAVAYVALALTPSSYKIALNFFEAPSGEISLGQPQEVRSDEWAVWTPYFQAAARNGFERFNETSVYREDLRNFNALPLKDWGLVFKPYFWPFFAVDAAYAFSFYHAFIIAQFLIGYTLFFRRFMGVRGAAAGLASVLVFSTSLVQFWWTTLGPVMAGFPWLLLLAIAPWRAWVRGVAMAYGVAFWLISHLYPPLILSLAFAALLLMGAFQPKWLHPRRVWPVAMGAAVGAGIAYVYFADALAVMAQTVYPGQRESMGGGVPWVMWLSQFQPLLVISGFSSLIGLNVCEVSVVGTVLLPLVLAAVRYPALRQMWQSSHKQDVRVVGLMLLGIACYGVWMTCPVPAAVGKVLFWHAFAPARHLFAAGVLLLCLSLYLAERLPLRITGVTIGIMAVIVAAGWCMAKGLPEAERFGGQSFVAALVLVPLLLGWKWWRSERGAINVLLCAALLPNVVAFAGFNPLQSAKPIFHLPYSPKLVTLWQQAAQHPKGWLITSGYPGAILNGAGFPSLTHVLVRPQLAFFRAQFPEMPEGEFNEVFNRYAHIQLTDAKKPHSPQADVIQIPITVMK